MPATTPAASTTPAVLRVGQWVEYHGSIEEFRGRSFEVTFLHPNTALILAAAAEGKRAEDYPQAYRYRLQNPAYGALDHVRRESVTPLV